MVVRSAVAVAVAAGMLLPALPATAYPMKPCSAENPNDEYTDSIGITWKCVQESGSGRWYWQKQPRKDPSYALVYSGPYLQTLLSFGVSVDSTGRVKAGSMAHASNALAQPWFGSDSVVARTVLQRWNGSAWTSCRDTGLVYSPAGHPTQYASLNSPSPPCGAGYYRDYGSAYIVLDGRWWGGSAASPFVYAVSPTSAAADDPVPPPPDE
jgi:hypothetical protein